MINLADAIVSLAPNSEWKIFDEEIIWLSEGDTPTDAEVIAEQSRLQAEFDSQQYARDRAEAYPPVTDYLDGIVKGDTAQVDKYVADCLAVKVKYPKP